MRRLDPVVELLNDDTEVEAGWAEAALKWFDDPVVAAVAPLVLRRSQSERPTIDSAGDRYYLGGVAAERGVDRALGSDYLQARPVFGASASSAFYRRDAVLAVGGFPEHFAAYFEDVDLSFRLHRAGGRIVYEPAARVWHRVSASYGRPSGALLEQQARNEERVFWQTCPAAPSFAPCRCTWPSSPPRRGVAGARGSCSPSSAASWAFWARPPSCSTIADG